MAKFHYMSDLHLEFGALNKNQLNFSGQYLLLAGDITLLNSLDPFKTDKQNRKLRNHTYEFFDYCTSHFEKVFYITGNHESYRSDILMQKELINRYLPKVHYMQDSYCELEDNVVLLGSTLWTSLNNANPNTVMIVSSALNDFSQILYSKRNFTPTDMIDLHRQSVRFLKDSLNKFNDKKVVVMTHHSPCVLGLNNNRYSNDYDHAYYTDLTDMVFDNPNLVAWVHGHTHVQRQYNIEQCNFYSNARGYVGYDKNNFDTHRFFEV